MAPRHRFFGDDEVGFFAGTDHARALEQTVLARFGGSIEDSQDDPYRARRFRATEGRRGIVPQLAGGDESVSWFGHGLRWNLPGKGRIRPRQVFPIARAATTPASDRDPRLADRRPA